MKESPEIPDDVDIVLLDSLGELAALYRIATVAFIGGTLVATGGHNPLEPARFAVPIVVGPSMENFREIAGKFNDAGAWRQVADAGGLAATWDEWLEQGDEAAGSESAATSSCARIGALSNVHWKCLRRCWRRQRGAKRQKRHDGKRRNQPP